MAEQMPSNGLGSAYVDRNGTIGIAAYLVVFTIGLLAALTYQLLLAPVDPKLPAEPKPADEVRLFLVVTIAGALGSLVHALRSFYWYVGNRQLVWSWAMMYFLLPFSGMSLALVFYLIIRGGLTQSTSSVSLYGYGALAALVGLFSEQALEKLHQVASSVFAEAPTGKNHAGPVQTESRVASPQPATPSSGSGQGPVDGSGQDKRQETKTAGAAA
jgi:hypothetical protein